MVQVRVGSQVWSSRVDPQKHGSDHGSTHLGKKKWGLDKVFFKSGQKILIRFAMSTRRLDRIVGTAL